MEVDDNKGIIVEAIDGFADEPMPKRQRHAAFASSCLSLKQQLSPLATELAQAVRALVEADKKADEEEQEGEEEEEEEGEGERGDTPTSKKTASTSTAPPEQVSAAASALEKLLLALSQARKAAPAGGGEKAVPEGLQRALDEWREGVEASCSRLQDLLDASPPPPRRHPSLLRPVSGSGNPIPPPPAPSAAEVAAVAWPLARRLGFTSRAPPFGWAPGQPLPPGGSRPPAPQEWQMRASGLRRLCAERFLAEAEARAAAEAAAAAAAAAAKKKKAPPPAAAAAATAAAAAPPAEATPAEEAGGKAAAATAAAEAQAPAAVAASAAAAAAPPRPAPGVLPGFELVLNPDLEEVEEEFSSDYESD